MAFSTMMLLKFTLCAGLAIVAFIICKILDCFMKPQEQEESTQIYFGERR